MIQKRRRDKVAKVANGVITDDTNINKSALRDQMVMANWELRERYPEKRSLMPTTLGNVLRAAEEIAGSRYGLDTVVTWPRLYPLLSDKLRTILDDQRNQLDFAARFCVIFLIFTAISTVLLFKHGWWLSIPAITLALAWLSYRAAVAAGLAYGKGIKAAYDLHRFDLLKALHLPLPPNLEIEKQCNNKLSRFLILVYYENFQYKHENDESAID